MEAMSVQSLSKIIDKNSVAAQEVPENSKGTHFNGTRNPVKKNIHTKDKNYVEFTRE